MDDELRDKVAKEIRNIINWAQDNRYSDEEVEYEASIRILSFLAPELEKAEKWRNVEEIAKRNWLAGYPCDGCPVENCCDSADSLCGQADALVQALSEGKEEG